MSNSESWTAVLSPITLAAVQAEATGAHAKHGEHSMLGAAVTESDRLAILTEEVGEVARELNEDRLGNLDGDWKIRRVKELIQVAAMALTWVEHLEGNLWCFISSSPVSARSPPVSCWVSLSCASSGAGDDRRPGPGRPPGPYAR